MWINNHDHLSLPLIQRLEHLFRVREIPLVPRKVLFVVCVLDVEPDCVVGDIVVIEPRVDRQNVVLGEVIPAALVMAYTEEGREWSRPGQFAVLLEYGV